MKTLHIFGGTPYPYDGLVVFRGQNKVKEIKM